MHAIPPIFHQIWFQGDPSVPEKYRENQKQWRLLHPEHQYRLWDEQSMDLLIRTKYSWFYDTWKNLPHMIQKIDSGKICILHSEGGLYIDMDISPLKNVWHLISSYQLVLSQCYVPTAGIKFAGLLGLSNFYKSQINNAVIGCSKSHPVMERTLRLMLESSKISQTRLWGIYIAQTCGPEVLIRAFEEWKLGNNDSTFKLELTKVYSFDYFEPRMHPLSRNPVLTKDITVSIHHCDRTWIKSSRTAKLQMASLVIIVILVLLFLLYQVKKRLW